jgi:hypothetical protein
MKDYRALHDTVVKMHQGFFSTCEVQAQMRPMLFVVCRNGDTFQLFTDFPDAVSRDRFCDTMRVMFKQWGVCHYCWTGEGWVARPTEDGVLAVDKRADRVEIVFTNAVQADGQWCSSVHEIVRDWNTGRSTGLTPRPDIIIDLTGSPFNGMLAT